MLLKAYAKINWSLDITGVRPDGYHLMDMVMQPVSLADDLVLTPASDLSIDTDGYPPCAADASNLAYKAAELLREKTGSNHGVHIFLHKRIPIGAGLGGDGRKILRHDKRTHSVFFSAAMTFSSIVPLAMMCWITTVLFCPCRQSRAFVCW